MAVIMATVFFTACTSGNHRHAVKHGTAGTGMFLNKVDQPYYEQTTDTVITETVKVIIQHGMTVWDIAETGTGMPEEEWKTIFDLNFDLLKDRLDWGYKNRLPRILIFPGEVLNLPSYYAGTSPNFFSTETVSHQTKYAKTKKILYTIDDEKKPGGVELSQRQLDSLGVTGSKVVVAPPKHPVVEPIRDREENASSFGWLWNAIAWILAILLLLFVIGMAIILLFGGFRRFMEFFDNNHQNDGGDGDGGDDDGDDGAGNGGDGGNNQNNTNNNGGCNNGCGGQQTYSSDEIAALIKQLQESGGEVEGAGIKIKIPTPPPTAPVADEPTTPTPQPEE